MTMALWRAALACTLLLPLLLIHARAAVEAAIAIVAVCFVAHSARTRSWAWLRAHWVPLGLAWWAWGAICSLPVVSHAHEGWGPEVQSLLVLRFLVFTAALEHWVLRDPGPRRWLFWSLAACTAYVALQTLLQFVTGNNLFGEGRSGDGELTGPFWKPEDGPTLVRMMFPPLVPAICALLDRRGPAWRLAAGLLALVLFVTLVLIGQRMPVLLGVLGFVVMGLVLRRTRRIVAVTVLAGSVVVASSAIVSPPVYHRLVSKFSRQMETFPQSPYGLILARSLAMADALPWTGRGFNAFKDGCPDPAYFHGWTWPENPADDGGGAAMCVTHAHSHYLEALTNSGYPGLLLFCALVVTWLLRLCRGLWASPDPLRVGLLIAFVVQEWPIASDSPLVSIPIGAWVFLLLGWGLAEARAAHQRA